MDNKCKLAKAVIKGSKHVAVDCDAERVIWTDETIHSFNFCVRTESSFCEVFFRQEKISGHTSFQVKSMEEVIMGFWFAPVKWFLYKSLIRVSSWSTAPEIPQIVYKQGYLNTDWVF